MEYYNNTTNNVLLQGGLSVVEATKPATEIVSIPVDSIGNIQTQIQSILMDMQEKNPHSSRYLMFKYNKLLEGSKKIMGVGILLDMQEDGLVKASITNFGANGAAIGATVATTFLLSLVNAPPLIVGGASFLIATLAGSAVKESIGEAYDNITSILDLYANKFTYDITQHLLTIKEGINSYNDAMMYAKFLESFYKDLDGSNLLGEASDSIGKIMLEGTDENNESFVYTIEKGDTVWDLCQKYDTTYDELIELNEWLAERFSEDREFCLIRPGEKIKIPYGSLELLGERPSFDKGFGNATSAKPIVDPMFLDLNNDGVIGTTSVSNGRYFDHEGDGYGELSSWVDKEDGVLVIDKNNDGVINNGNEIFGDNYIKSNGVKASNGFDALRDLDSNNDGVINSLDERFSELRILKGSGEIVSLEDVGITSISLDKVSVGVVDGNGNTLVYGGSFVREDGSIGNLGTFNIQVDKVLSEEVNKVTVSDDVKVLPDIRGYGVVHSLHQAIMLDNSGVLKGLVNDFINEEDINEKKDIVKRILNKWAGVENISDGSRGQYYDAKRLGVLEKFMGYGFVGENGSRNPNNSAGYYLEDSYASLYNHIYAQLEAQTALKDVFDLIDKVYDFETEEVSYDLSRVIGYIDSVIKEDEMKGKLLLGDFTNSFAHLWLKNNSNYTDYVEHFSSLGEEYDLIVRYTTSKEIIYGTNDADSITGGVEYEAVFGGDGNDTIRTNGGKDFIYGGDGDDYIEGGVNSDIIYGGSGNDSIYGGDGNDSIYGGDGDDFIDPGPTGHDKVYGGAGNDTIRNTTFQHGEPLYLDGGDGDDLIVGNAGNDTLIGGAGNDTIQTQGGNDFVYGGDGNDSIDVSGGNHTVDGGDGNDTIIYRGYSGHSTIAGGKGDDSISASLENYAPSGSHIEMTYRYNLGDGNDTIKTSQTSNTIEFGEGITKENIYFSGDKYDLVISFNNSEGSIRIQNGIASEIINKYIFSNGLTLNHQNKLHIQQNTHKYKFQLVNTLSNTRIFNKRLF